MNSGVLKATLQLRGWSQAELARRLSVSRQCVTLWLQSSNDHKRINIESKNLEALSLCLGVGVDDLLNPLPCTNETDLMRKETARLNWDHLYPDVVSLCVAGVRGEHVAVARIVQEYGLFASAKLLNKDVWKNFPVYKKFIKPARRLQLEKLWIFVINLKTH